ncbi:MAG: CHAT domain-containing protein [Crocosphaera sp.]
MSEQEQEIKRLVELLRTRNDDYILGQAVESLGRIDPGNPVAINALVRLLRISKDESILRQAAESLGKIGAGNPVAIEALVRLFRLRTSSNEYTLRVAARGLGKIGAGNPVAIEALIELLRISKDEYTLRQGAESLGKIDPGNPVAINALVQLLRISNNESILQQGSESLGEIDPGNPVALNALVQLLRTSNNESILQQGADSLGKIGAGNPVAINVLVKLLRTSNNESILQQGVKSLRKIGAGNPVAIDALVELLRTSNNESVLGQAVESLEEIGAGNPVAIDALVELLRTSNDKYRLREAAESLGKIGTGNPLAVEALVELLRTSNDEYRLRETAESLGKIGTGNPLAVEALVELILNTTDSALSRRFAAKSLEKIVTGNIKLIEKLRNLRHNQDIYSRWLINEILKKRDTSYQDSEQNQEQELSLFLDITRVQATVDYYFTLKDSRKAEFCYHRILACLDKMQTGTDIFTRRTLLESYLDTYQRIITFALKKRDFKRLFLYTEIFRNRYLVERLAKQDIPLPNTVSSELSQQIQEAKRIEKKALNIYTNKLNEALPELELKQFAQQWDNAKADLEKLYQQVAKHEPEFIAKTKITPLDYPEVQETLPSDTAIIEFFFTKYKLITLLILPGVESPRIPDALSVDLSSINLKDIADNWINNLSSKSKDKQEDIEKTKIDLDNIIDDLSIFLRFNQLLNFIPDNIKHLIIVPHNYLHLFPIHSLWINKKENKRLIDKFSVSYFPSLQVWKICQNRQRSQQSLLAIENPTEDKDLIFAKAEIASISQHQNFNQQQTLTEKNATIENILKNAENYHCLHFSGHAEYNFKNPLHSYLMLSNNTTDNLTLNTIFSDLHIPHTDLVILSACCTGVVDASQPTEEHLGLPTGFLLAGAKAVIASQWKVNSIATAFLFDEFYHQLQTTNNKAVALKNAQIWLRDCTAEQLRNRAKVWEDKLKANERIDLEVKLELLEGTPFESPYYWAAFMLTGC